MLCLCSLLDGTEEGMDMNKCAWKAVSLELAAEPAFLLLFVIAHLYDKAW